MGCDEVAQPSPWSSGDMAGSLSSGFKPGRCPAGSEISARRRLATSARHDVMPLMLISVGRRQIRPAPPPTSCSCRRRDRPAATPPRQAAAQPLECILVLPQLAEVAAFELRPLLRVVAEPPAQLRARRDILEPSVKLQVCLPDAPRPETLHQEPSAVLRRRSLVRSLQPNRAPSLRCSFHHAGTRNSVQIRSAMPPGRAAP